MDTAGSTNGEALFGYGGDDRTDGGAGNDLLDSRGDLAGTGDFDVAYGEAGNDTLLGGYGNDSLSGGTGNDDLDGGLGNDLLAGGPGDDIYRFGRGGGADRTASTVSRPRVALH